MPGTGGPGGPGAGGVDDLIRRMYEAAPDGFVAARTAAVAAARKAGDRDTAKRLVALRKPTVAAWLVNLLALRRPDLLDELIELAAELRSAQRELHGDQLRELSTQRRRAVSALVAEARRLAIEADGSLSAGKLPLAEVETTLSAALADADVAEQVRSGRLIRAATYAGFGEVPRPRLRLVTADEADAEADEPDTDDEPGGYAGSGAARADSGGPGRAAVAGRRGAPGDGRAARVQPPTAADRPGRTDRAQREAEAARVAAQRRATQRRRELQRELDAAKAAEIRAREELELADEAERDAAHAVADIESALADLERRRAAAQIDMADRKLARRAAQRAAVVARRRVGDVQAALEGLDDDPSG